MSKQRLLWSRIRKSTSFAALDFVARDLFHGLLVAADDQGRILGVPAFVRAAVWPLDDIKLEQVQAAIDQLVDQQMVHIYNQMDGKMVIQMVNWWKYQKGQWAGLSDYDAPEGWTDRIRFNGPKRKIVQVNWDEPGGFGEGMTITRPDGQPSQDQMDDHVKTVVNVNVNDNVNVKEVHPSGPVSLPGWMEFVKKEKNKSAALRQMVETLHPDLVEFPDFGYIGKTAKQVGGAGRLASLIWETAAKNVTGDLMAYCLAMAKGKAKTEQPASFAAIKAFAQDDIDAVKEV